MKKKYAFYGLDAPAIIIKFSLMALISLLGTIASFIFLHGLLKYIVITLGIITTLSFLYPALAILLGSLFFKFKVRDELLNQIPWKGNETVLDVGCGRGLLLIGAAKKVKHGKVIGIDIWNQDDQAYNAQEITFSNAQIEKVDNIEIITTDMRNMPFSDNYFNVIISSWAIHNISKKDERKKALQEIARVLKPEGYIALVDIENVQEYYDYLKENDFLNLKLIGPRYTFGTPSYILCGQKPQ